MPLLEAFRQEAALQFLCRREKMFDEGRLVDSIEGLDVIVTGIPLGIE